MRTVTATVRELALPKVGSTPAYKVGAPKIIENAGEKVGRNTRRSVGKLASATGVSCAAMQNVLRNDLNLSPCGKTEAQLLSLLARLRDCREPGFFWKGSKIAPSLQFCVLMRGCSLPRRFMVIRAGGQARVPRTEAGFCRGLDRGGFGWEEGPLFFIEEGLGVSQRMCLELLREGLLL